MERESYVGGTWQDMRRQVPRVVSAIVCRRPSPRRVARFSTPFWLLSITYTGHGLSRTRVGTTASPWTRRGPGSVHLYPPGTAFWEDTRGERGLLHSAWMHFTDAEAAGLPGLLSPEAGTLTYTDSSAAVGDLITEAAHATRVSADHGFWRAQSVLLRLIDLLLARPAGAAGAGAALSPLTPGRVSDLVRKADAYLAEHPTERVRLGEISRSVGVSSSALSHRYRLETGATPLARHRLLRIDHARALLLRRQSLKEIAATTGFTDAFHLSRTFKQVTGMSPREFLRQAFAGS